MKVLKYILGILAVLALIFFGRGLLTPEVSYKGEVIVNKSVEESWAVMSDSSRISEWMKEIQRMEPVSGTPNTVGAVSNVYVEQNGEVIVMEETINAIKANDCISMSFTMDFMNMDYEMRMKEKDGKTHITTKSKTKGNSLFAKSILSFMTGSMEKQEAKNLNQLKTVIEENTKVYPVGEM